MSAREIGSEFELDPALPGPSSDPGEHWSRAPDTTAFASGREALRALLQSSGRSRLVLPAYLCDSVEQAAPHDWDVIYVDVDECLGPRPDALAAVLEVAPRRTVVVRVQVFGLPPGRQVASVLDEAEEQGVLVVEDRTHAFLGPAHSRRPTFASARKWLALPDGGVLHGWTGLAEPPPASSRFARARRDALVAKWRFLNEGVGEKSDYLSVLGSAEESLDSELSVRGMSDDSRALLASADLDAIAQTRWANYSRLRAALESAPWAEQLVPIERTPPATPPLGLPVLSPRRDALRRFLIDNDVFCPVHWPLPERVTPEAHPVAHRIQSRSLTLVIDQRYGTQDMDRVSALLDEFHGAA